MATKKPTPTPYWKKEEATRDKMDYRNAGYSAAEKKAMAARKLAEAKKKVNKPTMKNGKFVIPASPTK